MGRVDKVLAADRTTFVLAARRKDFRCPISRQAGLASMLALVPAGFPSPTLGGAVPLDYGGELGGFDMGGCGGHRLSGLTDSRRNWRGSRASL